MQNHLYSEHEKFDHILWSSLTDEVYVVVTGMAQLPSCDLSVEVQLCDKRW